MMRKHWSSFATSCGGSRPRNRPTEEFADAGRWVGALLVILVATVLATASPTAARMVSQQVEVTIEDSGDLVERHRLAIRLDTARELDEWSPYPIVLDEHRDLEELSAWIVRPDGRRIDLKKDAFDTVEQPSEGILHDSSSYRIVRFPPAVAGTVLHLDFTTRERPYFPTGRLRLGFAEAVETLNFSIRGPDDLRWHLTAPDPLVEALEVDEQPGRVTVAATDFPPEDFEPPTLWFSWGQAETWNDVASWYDELVRPVPRAAPEVARQAAEVVKSRENNREKIEALLDFVRREVRYVAVEVGIGGYRPSSPLETLDRRWGDCKDKSFLLIDLLKAAGIESYPALLLASAEAGIDREFPSPGQFNHLIVALPRSMLDERGKTADEPNDDSYIFLDPTLTKGRLSWLPPAIQGQDALVIKGAESRLVTTPVDSGLEGRELDVRLTIDEAGDARGRASLTLKGRFGSALTDITSDSDRSLVARTLIGRELPGAQLTELAWGSDEIDGVPLATVSAVITLDGFVRGGETGSFHLPAAVLSPATSELDEAKSFPLALEASTFDTIWRLDLPPSWCPLATTGHETENRVGSFRQTIEFEDSVTVIRRHSEIALRWLEESDLDNARELALIERRVQKRRLRLRCP